MKTVLLTSVLLFLPSLAQAQISTAVTGMMITTSDEAEDDSRKNDHQKPCFVELHKYNPGTDVDNTALFINVAGIISVERVRFVHAHTSICSFENCVLVNEIPEAVKEAINNQCGKEE